MVINYSKWEGLDTGSEDEDEKPSSSTVKKSSLTAGSQTAVEPTPPTQAGGRDEELVAWQTLERLNIRQGTKKERDGNPRKLTWKQLDQEWERTMARLSQHPIFVKNSQSSGDSALTVLFDTIRDFVSGPEDKGLLYWAMLRAINSKSVTLGRHHLEHMVDPKVVNEWVEGPGCRASAMQTMFFASPTSMEALTTLKNFLISRLQQCLEKDVRANNFVNLRRIYTQQKNRTKSKKDREIITTILVHVYGDVTTSSEQCQIDHYVSPTHAFVIAIGNEGSRIFSSCCLHKEMPLHSLEEWIEQGGARLRDAKEMNAFMKAFDVLQKRSGGWNEGVNEAYKFCFGVDILEELAKTKFNNGERWSPYPIFRPLVRVLKYANVKKGDIRKLKWANPDNEWQKGSGSVLTLKKKAKGTLDSNHEVLPREGDD